MLISQVIISLKNELEKVFLKPKCQQNEMKQILYSQQNSCLKMENSLTVTFFMTKLSNMPDQMLVSITKGNTDSIPEGEHIFFTY